VTVFQIHIGFGIFNAYSVMFKQLKIYCHFTGSANIEKMTDKKQYKISIEGIIGCGKTKLLKYLENISEVEVVPEPVENWKNWHGENILDFFYRNP
jgi:hypothetical protein